MIAIISDPGTTGIPLRSMTEHQDGGCPNSFRGEFELRDAHVVATVAVRDGVIESVSFADGSGDLLPDAGYFAGLVRGRTVQQVLELRSELFVDGDRRSTPTDVATVEAFHRALESYLEDC